MVSILPSFALSMADTAPGPQSTVMDGCLADADFEVCSTVGRRIEMRRNEPNRRSRQAKNLVKYQTPKQEVRLSMPMSDVCGPMLVAERNAATEVAADGAGDGDEDTGTGDIGAGAREAKESEEEGGREKAERG